MSVNQYKTTGTCSRQILFEIEGDIIKSVEFVGGCSGNTQGVARLCEGMRITDAISRLDGIKCGVKQTSCPDQLAAALKEYLAAHPA